KARRSTPRPSVARRPGLAAQHLALAIAAASLAGCGGTAPIYATDIAPILSANCATCHRPGQGAPFTLLSYADARTHASDIAPVHHAVVHLDRTASSRLRDGSDGRPGFDGMGAPGAQEPDGHFIGWAPGRGPIMSADGMPWRLMRGTDLVLELHLIPGAAPVN